MEPVSTHRPAAPGGVDLDGTPQVMMRDRSRTPAALLVAGLLLASHAPAQPADGEWYGDNLERAVEKYGGYRNVPPASVRWIARTFSQSVAQVRSDLARQEGALIPGEDPATASAAASEPSTIPEEAWVDDPELGAQYVRMLEETIEKYGGVAMVPAESIRWLSTRWNREPVQIRRDLQRVDKPAPEILSDAVYAY